MNATHREVIIAIDGPAGAGKTTTAKEVARRLGFNYLDTGAMYRAIALHALRKKCNLDDRREIAEIANSADVFLEFENGSQITLLNGEDVSELVRSPEVSKAVTPVSEVSEVRSKMVSLQRELGKNGGIVIEGRDIGTIVFPDAELKFFLTADLPERARRRSSDFERTGITAEIEEVAADIEIRDNRDQSRAHSPLAQAPDAIVIDTTNLDFEEQVEKIIQHYQDKKALK